MELKESNIKIPHYLDIGDRFYIYNKTTGELSNYVVSRFEVNVQFPRVHYGYGKETDDPITRFVYFMYSEPNQYRIYSNKDLKEFDENHQIYFDKDILKKDLIEEFIKTGRFFD